MSEDGLGRPAERSSENFVTTQASAPVNFPAGAHAEHEDYQTFILKRTDDAVISDAVPPELAESTLKSFTDLARIFQFGDSITQELEDAIGDRLIEIVQLPLCDW